MPKRRGQGMVRQWPPPQDGAKSWYYQGNGRYFEAGSRVTVLDIISEESP